MRNMKDRMDEIDETIGKLTRVVHLLSGLGEHCTVESAKTTIDQAEDILNTVDLRELGHKIDWYEEDEDGEF